MKKIMGTIISLRLFSIFFSLKTITNDPKTAMCTARLTKLISKL